MQLLSPAPRLQLFSQKILTPTVAKEFPTGLYDPAEADLEHFWDNSQRVVFRRMAVCANGTPSTEVSLAPSPTADKQLEANSCEGGHSQSVCAAPVRAVSPPSGLRSPLGSAPTRLATLLRFQSRLMGHP